MLSDLSQGDRSMNLQQYTSHRFFLSAAFNNSSYALDSRLPNKGFGSTYLTVLRQSVITQSSWQAKGLSPLFTPQHTHSGRVRLNNHIYFSELIFSLISSCSAIILSTWRRQSFVKNSRERLILYGLRSL